MNYKETLEYLYNSTPVFEHVGASAYKEGLQNTLALDEHFGISEHVDETSGEDEEDAPSFNAADAVQ